MKYWKTAYALMFLAAGVVACSSDDGDNGGAAGAQGGAAGAQGGAAGAQGGAAGAQGGAAGAQGGAAGAQGGAAGAQGGAAGAQGGAAGAQGGSAGSAGSWNSCEKSCETQVGIGCKKGSDKDKCVEQCRTTADANEWCTDLYKKYIDCAATQPASNWECNPKTDKPRLKEGICAQEGDATLKCWFDGPSSGIPDMTADCKAWCDNIKSLSCAPKDCEAGCKAIVEEGIGKEKACRGAFANWMHCRANKIKASEWTCDSNGNLETSSEACKSPLMLSMVCYLTYCDKHPDDPDCKKN